MCASRPVQGGLVRLTQSYRGNQTMQAYWGTIAAHLTQRTHCWVACVCVCVCVRGAPLKASTLLHFLLPVLQQSHMAARLHAHTHTDAHTHAHTHHKDTHTHTHTNITNTHTNQLTNPQRHLSESSVDCYSGIGQRADYTYFTVANLDYLNLSLTPGDSFAHARIWTPHRSTRQHSSAGHTLQLAPHTHIPDRLFFSL